MKVLANMEPLEQLEADALVVLGFEGSAPEQVRGGFDSDYILDARVQEL